MLRRLQIVLRTRRLVFRILIIAAVVGSLVSTAHATLALPFLAWVGFHFALPTVVFSAGAFAAGARHLQTGLVLQGTLTVLAVGTAFTLVNLWAPPPEHVRWVLNFLVPATVSTLGALCAVQAPTPGRNRDSPL